MDEPQLRSKKPSGEGSWVWASRHLLEMITDIANETNQAASVRSIYLALTQLDRGGAGVVETTRAELCALAGVRYTTLDAGLKTLGRSGAIASERIRHRGLDTGLRIRLLSVPDKRAPVPVDGGASVPVGDADKSEEGIKNHGEEVIKEGVRLPAAVAPAALILGVTSSAPAPKPERARDPLFDSLASACGLDLGTMTKRERSACGTALAEIRAAMPGVTTEEIAHRVANFRRSNRPQWLPTPARIAGDWSRLGGTAPSTPRDTHGPNGPHADLYIAF